MHRSRRLLLVMASLAPFAAAPAWAAPAHDAPTETAAEPPPAQREQARTHANEGLAAFKAGDYQKAIDEFTAAERLVHAPPHVLYLARALAKLGRLVEARAQYLSVRDEVLDARAPAAFRDAQRSAKTELGELEPRIPRVAVDLELPAGVEPRLLLDAVPLPDAAPAEPLWIDPGRHTLRVEAAGYEPMESSFELAEGQEAIEVKLRLERPASSAAVGGESGGPSELEEDDLDLPLGPIVVTAAGIVVLAVGGITGGLALDRAGELRERCPTNPCPTEHESLADEANGLATVSTVSFIVGGLATAGGIAWLVADLMGVGQAEPSEERPDTSSWRVRPVVGLGSIGLVGVLP